MIMLEAHLRTYYASIARCALQPLLGNYAKNYAGIADKGLMSIKILYSYSEVIAKDPNNIFAMYKNSYSLDIRYLKFHLK